MIVDRLRAAPFGGRLAAVHEEQNCKGGWKEPLSMVPQKHTESGARSEKLTIPELEQSKAAVLNTLASVHSSRSYAFAVPSLLGTFILFWLAPRFTAPGEGRYAVGHQSGRTNGKEPPRDHQGGLGRLSVRQGLFRDAIASLPGGVPRGFDIHATLAPENANHPSDRVCLPTRRAHDLAQRRAFGPLHYCHHRCFLVSVGRFLSRAGGSLLRRFNSELIYHLTTKSPWEGTC